MASRSRKSGGGGRGGKFVTFFVVAGLIFAFFQIPYDPGVSGIKEIMISKSETVKVWANGIAPSIADKVGRLLKGGSSAPDKGGLGDGTADDGFGTGNGGDGAPSTGGETRTGSKSEIDSKVDSLTVANAGNVSYDRDEWNHWVNVRSCWTVREEVLAKEAQPNSLVLEDANGGKTTDVSKACKVLGGSWIDPYSGKTFTNPSDLDIDHMIPLNYAAQHGGQAWDSGKKESYANDLTFEDHLIAVSASENRSKSDKGPSQWKPTNKAYWCEYSSDWATIASTWGLSVTKDDVASLKEMSATC